MIKPVNTLGLIFAFSPLCSLHTEKATNSGSTSGGLGASNGGGGGGSGASNNGGGLATTTGGGGSSLNSINSSGNSINSVGTNGIEKTRNAQANVPSQKPPWILHSSSIKSAMDTNMVVWVCCFMLLALPSLL